MLFHGRGIAVEAGGKRLIEGLAIDIECGERVVVRGPSGIGKSLLLRRLAWLDPWDEGDLQLDGRTPDEWGAQAWRSEVCLVLQGAPELAGSPADWLRAVEGLAVQSGREVDDALDLARAWGLPAEAFDRPWFELSVGERQRCQLAIALSRRPRLLLLDEPTSALDPDAAAAFEESTVGCSALWVTHSVEQAARVADAVLELGA